MSTVLRPDELTGDYVFDTARTRVAFVARHTMSTRVRGHFAAFAGGARLDADDPARSRAWLTVEARSIHTGNRQRDDLVWGKFLDGDRHPALSFTSTGVTRHDETRYTVAGDLAVRDVVRQVALDLALTGGGTDADGGFHVAFKGGATIDRKGWGVNWNALTSLMVAPRVVLELDVVAVRKPR
ncbi:polyisoprenoid-binding protein [Streptomyces longispororuber]|uniref:Polyisoprenoid-binding protein n=1 Tax=Streptomyces longispororuber TaxID=68230 RepID=A0A919DIK6_9ACTN|nr:YceI family protein [Streptomyces longispororuber]GHE51214.1 polyisoprenoid-binding protein [Streptomyces longispororuber]